MIRAATADLAPFNYSALEPAKRRRVKSHAAAIRTLQGRIAADIVEAGRHLLAVRQELGYGEWSAWLRAEFSFTSGTANQWMRIAAQFAELDCLDRFHASALSELTAKKISDEVRTEAIELARSGRMVTRKRVLEIAARHAPPAADPVVSDDALHRLKYAVKLIARRRPDLDRAALRALLMAQIDTILDELGFEPPPGCPGQEVGLLIG